MIILCFLVQVFTHMLNCLSAIGAFAPTDIPLLRIHCRNFVKIHKHILNIHRSMVTKSSRTVTCIHGKPKPNHLGTLYAQSRRVTLAPPVLPRLLAQDLAGTCLSPASCHSLAVNKNFTVSSTFIILISVAESSFSLIVQDSSLLPTSSGLYLVSVTMWLCILQDQL